VTEVRWPRHERALEAARRVGADAVVATHISTVTWLTGYAAPIGIGPVPWAHTPLAILAPGEPPVLIVPEDEVEGAAATGSEVLSYPGYGIGPLDPMGHLERVLEAAVAGRVVATEPAFLPAPLAQRLTWVDASADLSGARAVKDLDELVKIRASVRVADAGQQAVREYAAPGMSELDLWSHVAAAMERAAGGPIPWVADLVSRPGMDRWEGPPGPRAISEGELVIADLSPCRDGYWADSCSTIAVGVPTPTARAFHRRILDRLEQAIAAVKPGVVAGDLDALVRKGLNYPHHSGHGIGAGFHEEPRIVPAWPTVLEPGMVLALEPGWYGEGEGVRLEWIVLVTSDGCEVLSDHRLDL
jgi:Xaa-Pro aminopeptidase